uniref:Uncharacterized protein n=1 Tax=Tetranychus urticae TaxID=32264 RepID=T1K186_TETUR
MTIIPIVKAQDEATQVDEQDFSDEEATAAINYADFMISMHEFLSILALLPQKYVHPMMSCISYVDSARSELYISRRNYNATLRELESEP